MFYTVKYYGDEIQIHSSKCLQPLNCGCQKVTDGLKCCYTAEEAKQFVTKYYEEKLSYIKNQSVEEFIYDQGFYE
jgi:hypothetical protein